MKLQEKYENLKEIIKNCGSLAVAFSGGVDSTFLLKTAYGVLGEKVVAVTACSRVVPQREQTEAKAFCEKEGIKHIFFDFDEMGVEGFAQNPLNRCYICKNALLEEIKNAVKKYDIKFIAEGSNLDDDGEYRPGFQAVTEHGVKSPLKEAGFSKAEIREISKEIGLPTWNKQSFACLATRFAYGETITEEKLGMVEKAEQLLFDLGFSQFRVRIHGTMARIEINPGEFLKIIEPEISRKIYTELKQYGFSYAALDLRGYRTGSMDEATGG